MMFSTIVRLQFNGHYICKFYKLHVVSYVSFGGFERVSAKEMLRMKESIPRRFYSTIVRIRVKADRKIFIQIIWSYFYNSMRNIRIIDFF